MADKRREIEEDEPQGAPEWMVTFSDCMTLLLTFFVLMISYSTFDNKKFRDLGESFGRDYTITRMSNSINKESMLKAYQELPVKPVKEGVKTPTSSQSIDSNCSNIVHPREFRNMKVFTFPSADVFWGPGTSISTKGTDILQAVARHLRNTPSRVVVSEYSASKGSAVDDNALRRAWAISKFLQEHQVNKDSISISSYCLGGNSRWKRTVEITLLEQEIYR